MDVLVCGGEPDTFLFDKSTETKTEDCNNPCEGTGTGSGGVAILTPLKSLLSTAQVADKLGLKIGSDAYNWWNNNPTEADEITAFLNLYWNGFELEPETVAFAALAIENLMENDNLEFEKLEKIYFPMQKECQARKVFDLIINGDTSLTNFIKNEFLTSTQYHL